jgi:sigma-E factor negative regulatory protein RseC
MTILMQVYILSPAAAGVKHCAIFYAKGSRPRPKPENKGIQMVKFGQVYQYDEAKGIAGVRFERPEACKKCGACGVLSQTGTISLKGSCKVGDWVRVEYPEGRFLEATAIAYVIPLAGLLLGLGLGWLLGSGGDGGMLLGALGGLGASVGILYLVNRRVSGRAEWTPYITAVYEDLPTAEEIGCQP